MRRAIGITNNPNVEHMRLKRKYPGLTNWEIIEKGLNRSKAMIMSVYFSVQFKGDLTMENNDMDLEQKEWSVYSFEY
jgi:hypothetical protein